MDSAVPMKRLAARRRSPPRSHSSPVRGRRLYHRPDAVGERRADDGLSSPGRVLSRRPVDAGRSWLTSPTRCDNGLAWITINRPERLQRLPRAHGRRADRALQAGMGATRGRRRRADRRRREGVLHRRRPEAARGDRRLRSVATAACSRWTRSTASSATMPKPVIAAVNGFAIGGGHVLHVLCDLTIAADTRRVRPERAASRLLRRRASAPATWRG